MEEIKGEIRKKIGGYVVRQVLQAQPPLWNGLFAPPKSKKCRLENPPFKRPFFKINVIQKKKLARSGRETFSWPDVLVNTVFLDQGALLKSG